MEEGQITAVVVINVLFVFIGTFGNLLIIYSVLKTPQLRQRPSNYLLLSLAVADLAVTMVVQPIYVVATALKTFKGKCSLPLDTAYQILAPFSCSCSAFHLAAISIDRVISAFKPHRHHEIIKKWFKLMLAVCWGSAAVIGSLLYKFPTVNLITQILIMVCEVIMISSYGMIIFKVKFSHNIVMATSSNSTARERAIENRMSGTIAIVLLLFAACWFPLVGYSFAHPDESFLCSLDTMLPWIRTLLLANSSMNFIVYSLRIREFRSAYSRTIGKMFQPCRNIAEKSSCMSTTEQNIGHT